MPLIHWPDALLPLSAALAPGLEAAAHLPWPRGGLFTRLGPPGWAAGALSLDPALLGPAVWVGADAALAEAGLPGALDRFRRLTGLLLEAGALLGAAEAEGVDPDAAFADPWRKAAAAVQVDAAAPALGWLEAAAVGLATAPGQSGLDDPRRLAWYLRFAAAQGEPTPPDAAAWARFGRWARDRARGPLSTLSQPVDPAAPRALPEGEWRARAFSHAVVPVEGGARGLSLGLRGAVAMAGDSAVGPGKQGVVVLGAVVDAHALLRREVAGPVGVWALRTGAFGAQVGAARGVELHLFEEGRVELVGADAFVGRLTPALLEMAQQVGVSGTAAGRWRLLSVEADGLRGQLQLEGLQLGPATLHPRQGRRFALPAESMLGPVRGALQMLCSAPITWTVGLEAAGPTLFTRQLVGATPLDFYFGQPGAPAAVEEA